MIRFVWAIALLFVVAGCTVAERDEMHSRPLVDAHGRQHERAEVADPRVRVSVTLGAGAVSVEEPVDVFVRVENLSDDRLLLGYGSSSCGISSFVVIDGQVELWPVIRRICTMDSSPIYLAPRASETTTLPWNGDVQDDPFRRLAPGKYKIVGVAGQQRGSAVTIEVRGD